MRRIGNDNSFDFSASTTASSKTFRVTVPSTGLGILTRTNSSASPNLFNKSPSASSTLSVRFLPDADPCTFTIYGNYCKPLLIGRSTGAGKMVLTMGSAVPSAPCILMIGTAAISVPLRGSKCYIHTLPVLLLTSATDPSGSVSFTLPIPQPRPSRVFMQGVTLDLQALEIFTTNGLRIDC